jgi:hypothetical protein
VKRRPKPCDLGLEYKCITMKLSGIPQTALIAIKLTNTEKQKISVTYISIKIKDYNYTSLHNMIEPLVINFDCGEVVQIKMATVNKEETKNFIIKTCKSI